MRTMTSPRAARIPTLRAAGVMRLGLSTSRTTGCRSDVAHDGAHLAAGRAGHLRDRLEHDLEVADALAETRDHGAARGLGEVGSGDEPDPDAAQRLLNDLALTDRESVEHGIEPEHATPVLSDEQVTGSPFQPGDDGQRPAAFAC